MASAAEEIDAGIELVLGAIKRLKAKDPEHELLQFAGSFSTMELPQSFADRFGGEHIPEVHRETGFAAAAMFLNYYNALQAAQ